MNAPAQSSAKALAEGFAQPEFRPIVWWAGVGLFWVVIQAIGYIGWIGSSDFAPVPVGDDPVPDGMLTLIRAIETVSIIAWVLATVYVIRTCVRDRGLSTEAVLYCTGLSILWLEPLYNWPRTAFLYNGYFFNMGNWTEHLPGWMNPTSANNPVPLLFIGFAYIWVILVAAVIVNWALNRIKAYKPDLSILQTIGIAFLLCSLMNCTMELFFLRNQLYAYPTTVHALSLWGGMTYQFPLYEAITWPAVMATWATVYHFRDDKGRTIVDRGVDRVKTVRLRPWLRVLAMIGLVNSAYMVHNVISFFMAVQADEMPAGYPSWLLTGQCGRGTDYECPGPTVPLSLPGSPPIPPVSGRN